MRFCIHSSQYDPANHTIISGPYNTLDQCNVGCGTNNSTTTTIAPTTTTVAPTTTSSTTPTTTSTSTTSIPTSVVPPVVNGNAMININDTDATIDIQLSTNGITWSASQTITMSANSTQSFSMGGFSFSRARATIAGIGTSPWSNEYTYTNPDNILLPSVNGNNVTNPNLFPVFASIQLSTNGTVWEPAGILTMDANRTTSFSMGGFSFSRVRLVKIGNGASVTAWSS